MNEINWIEFYFMLPFCFAGFLIHVVIKLLTALSLPGFRLYIFLKKQWTGWVIAWLLITVLAYLFIRKFDVGFTGPVDVVAVLLGITGGSAGKNLSKIIVSGTDKKPNEGAQNENS